MLNKSQKYCIMLNVSAVEVFITKNLKGNYFLHTINCAILCSLTTHLMSACMEPRLKMACLSFRTRRNTMKVPPCVSTSVKTFYEIKQIQCGHYCLRFAVPCSMIEQNTTGHNGLRSTVQLRSTVRRSLTTRLWVCTRSLVVKWLFVTQRNRKNGETSPVYY